MDMIQLAPHWRLESDTRWVLIDPDGRAVVSVTSKAELYHYIAKLGVPLTDDAKDELAALPEHHPKSPPLGAAQAQTRA